MMEKIPQLEDVDILMLEVNAERDYLQMFEHAVDKEMLKWTGNKYPDNPEDTKHMLKNYEELPHIVAWSIFLKETSNLAGVYWLQFPFEENGKLISVDAQRIGRKYWRTGVTSKARKLVYDYAFNKLKIDEIHSGAWADNLNSCLSMEKAGFTLFDRHEKFFLKKNKRLIENHYVLTKETWISFGK